MTSKVSLKSAKALGTNSNSSSENGSIQDKPEAESEKPDSQNSGYSADGSAAANLPVFIDLMEGNKHNLDNPCSPGQGHSIRRKIAELSFAASNAFADMEKGKLPFPKIEVNDFRKLAGWNVDMTKVKLKSANVVGDNPFLVETKIDEEILQGCAEYQKLFLATYETYEKVEGEEWGDSSTSSVTSSESDDGVNSNPDASSLVIHPRLEDALRAKSLKATEDAKPKRSSSKRKRCADLRAKIIHPLEKLPHITMNDALDASDEAR